MSRGRRCNGQRNWEWKGRPANEVWEGRGRDQFGRDKSALVEGIKAVCRVGGKGHNAYCMRRNAAFSEGGNWDREIRRQGPAWVYIRFKGSNRLGEESGGHGEDGGRMQRTSS